MVLPAIVESIRHWPPELATALLASVPLTEVRASIPLGIKFFHLSPGASFFWSFWGSLIPMPFVFWLFPPFLAFAEKHLPPLHKFMERHIRALEAKHRERYERLGAIVLFLFIALPIPASGVWSASVLALLFGIRKPVAAITIMAGIFCACLLVLLVTLGAIRLF